MRRNVSYEKVGTQAIGYFIVLDASLNRVSGLDETDFTFELYDPTRADIAGSVSFDVDEFASTGLYAVKWTVPASPQGEYTLIQFHPTYYPNGKTAVFLCYTTLIGDSGDASAALDFWVYDASGNPKLGLTSANFTWNVWNPSEVNVGASVVDPVKELGSGKYRFEFDASSEQGRWVVDLFNATYFRGGSKQGVYTYNLQSAEVAGAPFISAAVNDGTGNSATLSISAQNVNDEIFIYYRDYPSGIYTLYPSTRIGSGDIQITGLTNKQKYEFIAFASRSGSPVIDQSPPSNTRTVYINDSTTTFTEQRQALYDWVSSVVPLTFIWIPSNAPQPATPFGTIQMKPTSEIGHDYHSPPDNNGVETITGDREYMFEVQVYGAISPTGEDEAYSWALALQTSLQKRSILDELAQFGIAYVDAEPITDLGEIGRSKWEARALLEVRFRIGHVETDTVGVIETSDAPTGSFS
jgi:hypothetical protein